MSGVEARPHSRFRLTNPRAYDGSTAGAEVASFSIDCRPPPHTHQHVSLRHRS